MNEYQKLAVTQLIMSKTIEVEIIEFDRSDNTVWVGYTDNDGVYRQYVISRDSYVQEF